MATKPTPGGSDGTYGTELNAFLDVSLDADGKIKDGAVFSTSAAPTVDAAVANKKYVDDGRFPTKKVVTTSTAADSTATTNALSSAFVITEGKEAITVAITGLTIGDVIEVESFAVLSNDAGNPPQVAIFVDAVSGSLAVGANDTDQTLKGTCSVPLKAWFVATGSSHTFRLRFVGSGSTTRLNDAFGNTNISWISATQYKTGFHTIN